MKASFKPIIVSLIFAALIILSSVVLKGNPARTGVDLVIYTAWAYFFYRSFAAKKPCSVRSVKAN